MIARCSHEDRIQFNKAVIEMIETEYKNIHGNVRAGGRILTIADKRKVIINWKFDQMDTSR